MHKPVLLNFPFFPLLNISCIEPYPGALHRSYIIVQFLKCIIPERVPLTGAICERFSKVFRRWRPLAVSLILQTEFSYAIEREAKFTKRNAVGNILSVPSVVAIKGTNQIDLRVCKISINQRLRVRSWPCRLHESEIRGQGNQKFFSLSSPLRDSLSPLSGSLSLSRRNISRKTSGTRVANQLESLSFQWQVKLYMSLFDVWRLCSFLNFVFLVNVEWCFLFSTQNHCSSEIS